MNFNCNKEIIFLLVINGFLGSVMSSISIFDDKNATITTFDSLTASFGPSISDDGFEGYIALGRPLNGCSKMESPPNISYIDPKRWIALVQRTPSIFGNCSFDLKVFNAQRAGFAAIIIFNSESDNLIKMSSSGLYNIKIPSVFVGHSNGIEISQSYTYENKTFAVLYNDDSDINYLLIPFISVVSICFMIAICIFLTKLALHCHKVRKNRFPKSELRKIPTKKYQKTDKYDTCPICLNEYEEGVKIRILPCEHAYHVECIDKWLLRNNRLCPVCKRRVIPGGSDSDSEDNTPESSTTSAHQPLIENEPNEDEDTNESTRLLITTTPLTTTTTSTNNPSSSHQNANNANPMSRSPQQSEHTLEDTSSLMLLTNATNQSNNNLSNNNAINNASELSSLNNHMTTSIGSNSCCQLVQSGRMADSMVLSANNSTSLSKYGSITSINQVAAKNETSSTSGPTTSGNNEYDNLVYQDDGDDNDDDYYADVQSGSISSASNRAQTSSSAKHILLSNKNLSSQNVPPHIDSKLTPEFHSLNSASNSPYLVSTLDNEMLEHQQSSKHNIKVRMSKKKKHANNKELDMSKIAAKLELENRRVEESTRKISDQEQAEPIVSAASEEDFKSVHGDDDQDEVEINNDGSTLETVVVKSPSNSTSNSNDVSNIV